LIDVLNQKPRFSESEVFLINDAGAQHYAPKNPKGCIMEREKDRF
jgi:hypothetical protein